MAEIPKYSAGELLDLAFAILKLIRINNGGQVVSNVLQLTLDQFATWKTNGARSNVDELLGTTMSHSLSGIQLLATTYQSRTREHYATGRRITQLCRDPINALNERGPNFIETLYRSIGEHWEVDPEERDFPRMIWIILEG